MCSLHSKGLQALHEEELVDGHVAARLLGLSHRTVQGMASRRALPVYKIGRSIQYKVQELLDWRGKRKIS